jgi:hypothetical protein
MNKNYKCQELNLESLENIAGGRNLTQSEKNDYDATYRRYQRIFSILSRSGRGSEAFELFNKFADERFLWEKDINDAPDGSADILFSSRMEKFWPEI